MARYLGPRFKKCRSLGLNVFGHPKAMNRAQGTSARDAKKLSAYGKQLLEKQRLKFYYGILEKQMVIYFKKAQKSKLPGDAVVVALETRLDNVVYRLGLAQSLAQARQMVVHGHIKLNQRKTTIPSHPVVAGSTVALSERALKSQSLKKIYESPIITLPYLERVDDQYAGMLLRLPERHEIPIEIQTHLVVEYYAH
jgi:small subunit ribosomal protein S4